MSASKLWLTFIVVAVITFAATFLAAKFQSVAFILVWLLIVAVGFGWTIYKKVRS